MKATFSNVWFTINYSNKKVKAELIEITNEGYRFRDGSGVTYFVPGQVENLIHYERMNIRNVMMYINILDAGISVNVEKVDGGYNITNGCYTQFFSNQNEIRCYLTGILNTIGNINLSK